MRKLAIVTAGLTALAVLPFEASARVVTTSGTHLPSATINCAAAAATLRPYNLEQPRQLARMCRWVYYRCPWNPRRWCRKCT
jgi:hypothetical protein